MKKIFMTICIVGAILTGSADTFYQRGGKRYRRATFKRCGCRKAAQKEKMTRRLGSGNIKKFLLQEAKK